MYTPSNMEEIELHLHKALNLIEQIDIENCFCPRAKEIVITKIEEALLWMNYKGRSFPTENKRGIKGKK
jgi:hypothetical protein